MKEKSDRTKVVLRHLPPALTQAALVKEIDRGFSGRYEWLSFRPGRTSNKNQSYSRAYVNFKKPEDVIEFAEFFNGHVFVNEKGSQFKIIVEYAPSQRVPNKLSKKDVREGTISKDPAYLEFLEFLAKPIMSLPSAEIQLERKEAERAAAAKEAPIVTPLMDFVREKRAAKNVLRRAFHNGKQGRRGGGSVDGNYVCASSKQDPQKKRNATAMYVIRHSAKSRSDKNKISHITVPRRDNRQLSYNSVTPASAVGKGYQKQSGSAIADGEEKKIILLKEKGKEISHFSGSMSQQQRVARVATPVRNTVFASENDQQCDGSGRITGSIVNNNAPEGHLPGIQPEHQSHILNLGKDNRPPRPLPPRVHSAMKDKNRVSGDGAENSLHLCDGKKHEKHRRSRDRPERGIWNLHRSDRLQGSDEPLSSFAFQPSHLPLDPLEGFHKHGCHGPHRWRDTNDSSKEKVLRRRGGSNCGFREKKVWVQRSSAGS